MKVYSYTILMVSLHNFQWRNIYISSHNWKKGMYMQSVLLKVFIMTSEKWEVDVLYYKIFYYTWKHYKNNLIFDFWQMKEK